MIAEVCLSSSSFIGLDKILLSVFFLSLAFISFIFAKNEKIPTKSKIMLIYSHVVFLFMPVIVLTTNTACGTFCLSCHNNIFALTAISLPVSLGIGIITGMIAMPELYIRSGSKKYTPKHINRLLSRYSKKLSIKKPNFYVVNTARPVAFSFRSAKSSIFMSVGMLELLTKKEVEAVVLHEISHIKNWSSALKVSSYFLRISPFSLIYRFNHDLNADEENADRFAIREQGTRRHIISAKRKTQQI